MPYASHHQDEPKKMVNIDSSKVDCNKVEGLLIGVCSECNVVLSAQLNLQKDPYDFTHGYCKSCLREVKREKDILKKDRVILIALTLCLHTLSIGSSPWFLMLLYCVARCHPCRRLDRTDWH